MTTTPKKAPTASEALRELCSRMYARGGMPWSDIHDLITEAIAAAERAEAEAAQEPGDLLGLSMTTPCNTPLIECAREHAGDFHFWDWVEHAERCHAQEPGDSVEGLMRECGRLAMELSGDACETVELNFDSEYGDWLGSLFKCRRLEFRHTGRDGTRCWREDPCEALRILRDDLRDALKPAAPDATWLDDATFEEMEPWLPEGAEILMRVMNASGYAVALHRGTRSWRPTRLEAVRACLKANPELWKDRR